MNRLHTLVTHNTLLFIGVKQMQGVPLHSCLNVQLADSVTYGLQLDWNGADLLTFGCMRQG